MFGSLLSTRNRIITSIKARNRAHFGVDASSTYVKKSPIEHVLLRPGMYVGQVDHISESTWLYDEESGRMKRKLVTYSPALIKIFDEILVNAADNKERDKKMSYLNVSASYEHGKMSVEISNNGKSIPVVKHKTEKLYIPTLVFGHLLTGSNFEDSQNLLTGGRHGYGAKLTNIFSNEFSVETYDNTNKAQFSQTWSKNMSVCTDPIITKGKQTGGEFMKIKFSPDLSRFGVVNPTIVQDTLDLFQRRAIDIAGCLPGVTVSFNNRVIPVHSFVDYISIFQPPAEEIDMLPPLLTEGGAEGEKSAAGDDLIDIGGSKPIPVFHEAVNEFWEVAVAKSSTGQFECISFVNSVSTKYGGTHVDVVAKQIIKAFQTAIAKKSEAKTVEGSKILSKLMIMVKSRIPNPSFDSQSKDRLSTDPNNLGSQCVLSDKFLRRIVKSSGVLEDLLNDMSIRERNRLLRAASTPSNKAITVDVPKLEDAHLAGHPKHSSECTLILTEGDSAKALAVSGLEVVGRQTFGVLPLRGKILNARVANSRQVSSNEELIHICKALGLDFQLTYDKGIENAGLRYGKVLLMCDQDDDGSHIKGLIINFFHHFWPNLLNVEGFLQQFITPLVKVKSSKASSSLSVSDSGKKKKSSKSSSTKSSPGKDTLVFYSLPEYSAWRKEALKVAQASIEAGVKSTDGSGSAPSALALADHLNKKYDIKYYKGLGTNTAAEGKEYFSSLDRHRKQFYCGGNESDAIDKAFNKHRSSDRKLWLSNVEVDPENCFVDPSKDRVSYEEFIDKELIRFSYSDNQRSIPSVVDGLKPSQRKILHACFKKNLTSDMKVGQLAGYVAEQTAYHHGEASLHAAIVKMAAEFVGANNLPLLVPSGQFGTRAAGGEDFASPRYIFTRLSPLTRYMFPAEDDAQLQYLEEDGQLVEPNYFIPIIPMLLVNGTKGIGTGWSTSIPGYNPLEIVNEVTGRLRGNNYFNSPPQSKLIPWTRGFTGSTVKKTETQYITSGKYERASKTSFKIVELPVGKWTNDYKEHLNKLCANGTIKSFSENHTTETVDFTVTATATWIDEQMKNKAAFEDSMMLTSSINLCNMHAFDSAGKIRQYESANAIMDEHFVIRLQAYVDRKKALSRKYSADELLSRNKSRFVASIVSKELNMFGASGGVSESELIAQLQQLGFVPANEIQSVLLGIDNNNNSKKNNKNKSNNGSTNESEKSSGSDYSYLLDMSIHSLTDQRSQQLHKAAEAATEKLKLLEATSEEDLWCRDLVAFADAYETHGNR